MGDRTMSEWLSLFVTIVLGSAMAAAFCAVTLPLTNFSNALLNMVAERWGETAITRLLAWQALERSQEKATPNLAAVLATQDYGNSQGVLAVLTSTNKFFNELQYYEDIDHWGVPVYWATPVEFLASNGGDCVDYAVAKYFSLRSAGVSVDRLRMTYVRALQQNQAHMVLAYYSLPDADPLILDNLINEIKPASQRPDLQPVYSFNDDDLWTMADGKVKQTTGASHIKLWENLIERIAKQQQM